MEFDHDLLDALTEFGTVLSVRFADRPTPLAFKRDDVIETLQQHLGQASHNSFVLVGPSGCGKTAILHELFRRIARRDEQPWIVLETSTSQLMAGTSYIGEWQTRVDGLIRAAERSRNVLVYLTDLHLLPQAGRHSKSDENMGGFFAQAMEQGTLTVIGEATPENYRRGVEQLPSFHKLFGVFRLEETESQETAEILTAYANARRDEFALDSGVQLVFPDQTLLNVQEFGRLYFPGFASPGGAIKLLDQLISRKTRDNSATNDANADYASAASVSDRIEFQPEDVVRTLETSTGIPSRLLDDTQPLRVSETRKFFESRVIGQSAAVDAVLDLITLIKAGLTNPSKPQGVLFFVGPTGVGKTELAKALAEFIFGSADRLLRFDMSEFKDYHSFEKLIGNANARNDSLLQQGNLLSRVRQQPFSVILLDEIEKAHANIFDVLLQVFDAGRLTDSLGQTTNFTQTIIIMTSNLGSDLHETTFGFQADAESAPPSGPPAAMEEFFRPEFINRIDRIISFKPLEREHARILAQRELGQVLLRSGITRRELRVDVDPGVIDILVRDGFSPVFGARPLKRAVETLALLPIARQIVQMTGDHRQALLRLIPNGRNISARVVEDRQTRRQETLVRGVPVVDPIVGTKSKLKPKQIAERITQLTDAITSLEQQCRDKKLEEQKTELLHLTTQKDFWDVPSFARETLGEIYRIERLLEAVGRVRTRLDSLESRYEAARNRQDADEFSAVAERAAEVQLHADLVKYSLECRGKFDRGDAFVQVSAVAEDAPQDLAHRLCEMYANWATLKGFGVKTVHEELSKTGATADVVLLIEGVAAFGILRGEDGMHEFVFGRTSDEAKQSFFVRVRVLPLVDSDDDRVPAGEISVNSQRSRGTGLRCNRYRSRTQAKHQASALTVSAQNDLQPDEARPLVEDWLQSELYRQRSLASVSSVHRSETAIRKYTIRPQPHARDNRTGVTSQNLSSVWKGEIDEFLYAALISSTETTDVLGS
ncbi:AAA family ATPase [Thalassoroseus pseudoceratinae]|uniref:AAA family ATPase n=1 Tax=Thalassoroseus pseudoceratinae TaxID=2713176 RepID=UPI0014219C14|nr:AAA family ATPase [Thalassoroseus pseudoceratinae]